MYVCMYVREVHVCVYRMGIEAQNVLIVDKNKKIVQKIIKLNMHSWKKKLKNRSRWKVSKIVF